MNKIYFSIKFSGAEHPQKRTKGNALLFVNMRIVDIFDFFKK